jgi:hypothetical protein
MKRQTKHAYTAYRSRQRNDWLLWSFFIGACFVAVVVVIAMAGTAQPPQIAQQGSAEAPAPHYPQAGVSRTITFGKPGTLDTNKDHALVGIIEGNLPAGTTHVTVMSDENCVPDSQGISHCLNRLSYGGGEITVRHTHNMAEVPCLQPGEVLQVTASNSQ